MSTSDDDSITELNSQDESKPEPLLPERRMEKVLEQLQVLSLRKGRENGFDISKFNEGQVDRLLGILEKNEDNAFKYHSKKIDSETSISEKKIGASIVDQKTFRYALLISISLCATLTIVIIIFEKQFFIPWLTFLTGIAGGFGLGKIKPKKIIINKNEDESGDSDD
jgi:hypothetical protein